MIKIPLWTQMPLFIVSFIGFPKLWTNDFNDILNPLFIIGGSMTIFLVIYCIVKQEIASSIEEKVKE